MKVDRNPRANIDRIDRRKQDRFREVSQLPGKGGFSGDAVILRKGDTRTLYVWLNGKWEDATGASSIRTDLNASMQTIDRLTDQITEITNAVKVAPTWSSIPAQTAGYDEAFSLDLKPFVSGLPTPTITATGLPEGLNLTNGIISGQSTDSGVHQITVTARNPVAVAQTTFNLTVNTT